MRVSRCMAAVAVAIVMLFVFIADSQRKGLEKRFQQQKYISKPDRKKLAERLGLKDSQVSVAFIY